MKKFKFSQQIIEQIQKYALSEKDFMKPGEKKEIWVLNIPFEATERLSFRFYEYDVFRLLLKWECDKTTTTCNALYYLERIEVSQRTALAI